MGGVKLMVFLWMCGYLVFSGSPVFPYQLPDTGQHKCYNNEKEIPCPAPGQPFYGQDAQYKGYEPSYTDNGNKTVTDLNTGLVWQQEYVNGRPWEEACDYCDGLKLGSRTDWRLPTKREIASIPNYGKYLPAIDTDFFPDCRNWRYWSSSATTRIPDEWAWYVDFADGTVWDLYMDGEYLIRCVRGESPKPESDFVDNGNGTVTDRITGLVWQQGDAHNDGEGRTWQEALAFCEALSLGGRTDWRLPNVRELESLTDVSRFILPAIDPLFECNWDYYWSSTTHAGELDQAWRVYFGYGSVNVLSKSSSSYPSDPYCVRCVRGGAVEPVGSYLYVNSDGSCAGKAPCYTTIQAAIDAAEDGDTILVCHGTYNENIVLDDVKSLNLLCGRANDFGSSTLRSTVNSMQINTGFLIVEGLCLSGTPLP